MFGARNTGSALRAPAMLSARMLVPLGRAASGGGAIVVPSSFALDLSGVSTRQLMTTWDSQWFDEYSSHFLNFQWQVDPGNGGQIGVWADDGNPASNPGSNLDYSNFIAAGPAAGMPTRVRMRLEHQPDGAWISCCHTDGSDENRAHYEVALQSGSLKIFKFFGPDPSSDYVQVATQSVSIIQGNIYWIELEETRSGNAIDGIPTIDGELFEDDSGSPGASIETIQYVDDGTTFGSILNSTNKRGFGSFSTPGASSLIFAWDVQAA
jgi:hypothetical protein